LLSTAFFIGLAGLRLFYDYYTMGKSRPQSTSQNMPKHVNRFAVLADTDSDAEENSDVCVRHGEVEGVEEVGGLEGTGEVAGSEEVEGGAGSETASNFRVWKNDTPRFSPDVFSSPFTRKNKKKEESWVSIDGQSVKDEPQREYPSLLNRSKVDDETNALAWAEKVKFSLDKAKGGKKSEKMSFFRSPYRNIVLDEKF
jgi:hypothetical protein